MMIGLLVIIIAILRRTAMHILVLISKTEKTTSAAEVSDAVGGVKLKIQDATGIPGQSEKLLFVRKLCGE